MRQRKLVFSVLLTLFVVLFLELSAYALIYVSRPYFSEPIRRTTAIYSEQSDHIRQWLAVAGRVRDIIDSDLGWRYRAGHNGRSDQINSQGLRSNREFSPLPANGVLRVAAFGDSYVYGNEVANEDAWASVVDAEFDSLELLNYGVGGYGLDQALLRYRIEGNDLAPDVVLIGFIADDIRRVVSVYQRFASTSSGIFTKPRFELGPSGDMRLLASPIQTLDDWRSVLEKPDSVTTWGQHDQWYEPLIYENPLYDLSAFVRLLSTIWIRLDNRYFDSDRLFISGKFNTAATAYELQMDIFEAFAAEVRASGAHPIVLILPSRGELTAAFQNQELPYVPILQQLGESQIDHWDATEAFLAEPDTTSLGSWFERGGHYSPAGNRIVASWLGSALLELQGQLAD